MILKAHYGERVAEIRSQRHPEHGVLYHATIDGDPLWEQFVDLDDAKAEVERRVGVPLTWEEAGS